MGFLGKLFNDAVGGLTESGISKSREMAAMVASSDPERARELLDKAERASIRKIEFDADRHGIHDAREREAFIERETRKRHEEAERIKYRTLGHR